MKLFEFYIIMRIVFTSLIIVFACGCSASKNIVYTKYIKTDIGLPQGSQVYLKTDTSSNVRYMACVNYDDLNVESSNILYPGDTAGIFLGSVLAHSLIVNSAKNSKKQKLQIEADKVLLPYQDVIANFTNGQLITKGIDKIEDNENFIIKVYDKNSAPMEWVLESRPVYFMANDQRALLLKNIVSVYSEKIPSNIIYENMAEIVSFPFEDENPEEYWLEGQSPAIVETSAELFAESIELIMKDIFNKFSDRKNKEQTLHYYLGGEKIFERGQLLSISCNRMTIRTLRGWLKSVPVIYSEDKDTNQDNCK